MKKMVSFLLIIFMLTIVLTSNNAQAAAIKISKTKATMEVDSTLKLKITGTDAKITWSTSKKSVATVNSTGTITAIAEGKATITATVSTKKYSCKVSVVDNNKADPTPTPKPTAKPTPTPVPEPESADRDTLNEKEAKDLTLNTSKYLGKYVNFNAEIATEPIDDGYLYTCLVYQDSDKSKVICIHYFDKPGFKLGDKVMIFGYIENIYTGPGVDGNEIDAPLVIIKGMDLVGN